MNGKPCAHDVLTTIIKMKHCIHNLHRDAVDALPSNLQSKSFRLIA